MKLLAIDPGKSGGVAYYNNGDIELRKFTTEGDLSKFVEELPSEIIAIVEDVPKFVSASTSSSSSFKLGYNYGYHMGSLRTRRIPVNLVKPQVWQKGLQGLRPKMGYTDRKRILKDNAMRLYPDLKITHATADALLILNWYLNKS